MGEERRAEDGRGGERSDDKAGQTRKEETKGNGRKRKLETINKREKTYQQPLLNASWQPFPPHIQGYSSSRSTAQGGEGC